MSIHVSLSTVTGKVSIFYDVSNDITVPRYRSLNMPGPSRLDWPPSQLALLVVCRQPQQKSGRKQPEMQTQTLSLMRML